MLIVAIAHLMGSILVHFWQVASELDLKTLTMYINHARYFANNGSRKDWWLLPKWVRCENDNGGVTIGKLDT